MCLSSSPEIFGVSDAVSESGLSLKTHTAVGRCGGPAVGNVEAPVEAKVAYR